MNVKGEFVLFFLVFGILAISLFAEGVTQTKDKKKTKISIYMDSQKDRLMVTEPSEGFSSKEIDKIIFNNKDYTKFAKKLLSSQPLCFASSRILIFGKESVKLINDQWKCAEGVLFIPGKKEILIITAVGISFDEGKKVLELKSAKVETISLDKKRKEKQEHQEMIIDLSKIE